jgi:flavin-binding protein dodecin
MKKTIYILAITAFIGGISLVGCKSNSEEKADAVENVNEANQDLDQVEADQTEQQITKANDAEWQTYKAESNKTIAANEAQIVALRKAMDKPGKTFDKSYASSIDALEEKNTALKTRIVDYENNQTDWESFKREFKSDAEGVANAFKDLTVNNKK